MRLNSVTSNITILLSLFMATDKAFCVEREIELEPIVVDLKQIYTTDAIPTKDVSVIYIKDKPETSLQEMLDELTGVNVSTRSIMDVQSDLSIRGSTPEQASVSLNGITLNNPQTAHHNLDLWVPSIAMEKSEVIEAASSVPWSQGVMGGAVNIVTRRPETTGAEASFWYGTYQTHKDSLYMAYNREIFGFNFAAEDASSNGWRYDTDFREFSLSSSGLLNLKENIKSHLFFSYGEKEFGAANFYGPYNSKEWTDGLSALWQTEIGNEKLKATPMLYFNRHYDKYMLDIARPDYYLNHHMTDIEGIRVESKLALGKTGSFLGNIDFNRERIKSTRLGKHGRDKNSFSLAWQNYELGFLGYDLSLLVDDYSEYDTKVLPQAAIFFMLEPHTKLRASFAKCSREPTYTELYYDSPANKGNANLSPEQAYNYEAGIDLDLQQDYNVFLSLTVFRRDSSDLIDWVKDTQSQAYYQARNITKVKTEGVDVGLSFKPIEWAMVKGGYTYIDSDIEKDYSYISKYALNHPDHKVSSQLDFILPFGIQSVRLLYKDRKKYANYLVMGCDLNYKVNKNSSLFVVVDNIFNSGREDIRDNKLPGREINVGIRLVF